MSLFAVLFAYDFLLTFGDEIRLFWMGHRSSGASILFLLNRYLTLASQVLGLLPTRLLSEVWSSVPRNGFMKDAEHFIEVQPPLHSATCTLTHLQYVPNVCCYSCVDIGRIPPMGRLVTVPLLMWKQMLTMAAFLSQYSQCSDRLHFVQLAIDGRFQQAFLRSPRYQ